VGSTVYYSRKGNLASEKEMDQRTKGKETLPRHEKESNLSEETETGGLGELGGRASLSEGTPDEASGRSESPRSTKKKPDGEESSEKYGKELFYSVSYKDNPPQDTERKQLQRGVQTDGSRGFAAKG